MKYIVNEWVEFICEIRGKIKKGSGQILKTESGGLFSHPKYLIETIKVTTYQDRFGRLQENETEVCLWITEDNIIKSLGF